MRKIRLALVDDHRLFREALAALLARRTEVDVVGQASDERELLALVTRTPVDVIVLDLALPTIEGLTLLRDLQRRGVKAPVLVLTMHEHADMAADAFAAGAAGYALKRQNEDELVDAIEIVAGGGKYVAPSLPRSIVEGRPPSRGSRGDAAGEQQPNVLKPLSSREREIFALLVRGHDNAAIGRMLAISAKTAETHRTRIMKKLGVHSLGELIRLAARFGLLPAPAP